MFETEVERGMTLLDREFPGWEDRIDLEQFDISDLHNCTLGQLYGSFGAGCRHLAHGNLFGPETGDWVSAHGFDAPYLTTRYWPALTTAWVEAIQARRQMRQLEQQVDAAAGELVAA